MAQQVPTLGVIRTSGHAVAEHVLPVSQRCRVGLLELQQIGGLGELRRLWLAQQAVEPQSSGKHGRSQGQAGQQGPGSSRGCRGIGALSRRQLRRLGVQSVHLPQQRRVQLGKRRRQVFRCQHAALGIGLQLFAPGAMQQLEGVDTSRGVAPDRAPAQPWGQHKEHGAGRDHRGKDPGGHEASSRSKASSRAWSSPDSAGSRRAALRTVRRSTQKLISNRTPGPNHSR